ncbi:unnamed protein product [Cylicostephanus goldi]|uniref:Uncharacterized protein n=1 Tax=Cylicostephanus goldi TaxID=71465 RepID=A0A3P6QSH1_CYLGO|nr:unnamed protein product [Cylicostephanus goldi]
MKAHRWAGLHDGKNRRQINHDTSEWIPREAKRVCERIPMKWAYEFIETDGPSKTSADHDFSTWAETRTLLEL